MRARGGEALDVALGLLRAPGLRTALRARPLPGDVAEVLAIASGSAEGARRAAARTGYTEAELVEGARFYVQQVLLAEDADAYRILGAPRGADHATLRDHHRLLLRWLHPDRSDGQDWDSALAARVNQAWNQLRTIEARAQYDAALDHQAAAAPAASHRPPTLRAEAPPPGRAAPLAVAALGVACLALIWLAMRREDRPDVRPVAPSPARPASTVAAPPAPATSLPEPLAALRNPPTAAPESGPGAADKAIEDIAAAMPGSTAPDRPPPDAYPEAALAAARIPTEPAPVLTSAPASTPAPATVAAPTAWASARPVPVPTPAPVAAPTPATERAPAVLASARPQSAPASTPTHAPAPTWVPTAAATPAPTPAIAAPPAPAPATRAIPVTASASASASASAPAPTATASVPLPSPQTPPARADIGPPDFAPAAPAPVTAALAPEPDTTVDDDPLRLLREAEATVLSVVAYLAAQDGPAPAWQDALTGRSAANIRRQLHARSGAPRQPSLALESPNWTLGSQAASVLGTYRLHDDRGPLESGLLHVELARRHRQWQVIALRLEPNR